MPPPPPPPPPLPPLFFPPTFQGEEHEIVIARNGRPVAKLVPIDMASTGKRIGVAKGKFEVPDNIDAHNEEITRLFLGGQRP
ncbi:type II toxin-antitoxin system Phd/YefM family antitoxin [Hydrogenophilus thermoluteolus]|uniref:type II toxin-antitoxin system Phd/YefM family antitoxin n=1 Tax=Hydrogenophilus thermoluteolus TaxID=297 RepID=UPI003F674F36